MVGGWWWPKVIFLQKQKQGEIGLRFGYLTRNHKTELEGGTKILNKLAGAELSQAQVKNEVVVEIRS